MRSSSPSSCALVAAYSSANALRSPRATAASRPSRGSPSVLAAGSRAMIVEVIRTGPPIGCSSGPATGPVAVVLGAVVQDGLQRPGAQVLDVALAVDREIHVP